MQNRRGFRRFDVEIEGRFVLVLDERAGQVDHAFKSWMVRQQISPVAVRVRNTTKVANAPGRVDVSDVFLVSGSAFEQSASAMSELW